MGYTKSLFFTFLMMASVNITVSQVPDDSELFLKLKKQDSIFFERGFNRCDFEYPEKAIHADLLFYHDQSGIQNRNNFLENVKNNICSTPDKKPIRKLEENSLQVFPMYKDGQLYGAIQSGIHDFYIREPHKEDVHTSRARFTHLWLLENGNWLLKEVLSYEHIAAEQQNTNQISFENEITQLLIEEKVPALGLGIIQNGKLHQISVYGNLKEGVPAPYNSLFKVASLTKPIVALVTLKLISSGQLDLDEPLFLYWTDPDIKNDKRTEKLTPRIVLSHQTGFPNWRYMTESNKLTFEFEPGTKYQYSGEGFEYLRKALEARFGKSMEQLADSLVFKPAKMTDSHFWWDNTMDETRYAENHDSNGKLMETYKYYKANAAANLITTVEDYGNFVAYVLNGGGLSEAIFSEMLKNQVQLTENEYFGLGWEKITGFESGEYVLIHSGKDPGVSTLAVLFPESKNGYVIFLNGDNTTKIYETLLTKHLYSGQELWGKK